MSLVFIIYGFLNLVLLSVVSWDVEGWHLWWIMSLRTRTHWCDTHLSSGLRWCPSKSVVSPMRKPCLHAVTGSQSDVHSVNPVPCCSTWNQACEGKRRDRDEAALLATSSLDQSVHLWLEHYTDTQRVTQTDHMVDNIQEILHSINSLFH